jgi:hypothetical protein
LFEEIKNFNQKHPEVLKLLNDKKKDEQKIDDLDSFIKNINLANDDKLTKIYKNHTKNYYFQLEEQTVLKIKFENNLFIPFIIDKLSCLFETVFLFVPYDANIQFNFCIQLSKYTGSKGDNNYLKNNNTKWIPKNLQTYLNFIFCFLSFIECLLQEGFNYLYPKIQILKFPFVDPKYDKTVLMKYLGSFNK